MLLCEVARYVARGAQSRRRAEAALWRPAKAGALRRPSPFGPGFLNGLEARRSRGHPVRPSQARLLPAFAAAASAE